MPTIAPTTEDLKNCLQPAAVQLAFPIELLEPSDERCATDHRSDGPVEVQTDATVPS